MTSIRNNKLSVCFLLTYQTFRLRLTCSEKGLGADNAPGHTEGGKPGDAPVAGDSYASTVGVEKGTNQPGEEGNVGQTVGHMGSDSINQGNLK